MKPKYWAAIILAAIAASTAAVYYAKQPATDLGPVVVHHKQKPQSPPSTTPITDLKDWKTYTNTEYGFEIKYPQNYEVGSPPKSDVQGNTGLVNLAFTHFGNGEILDSYGIWVNSASAKDINQWVENHKAELFREDTQKKTLNIGGNDAIELTTQNGGSIRVFVLKNNYIYSIDWPDFGAGDQQDLDRFIAFAESFKFTSPQASVDTSGWKTYTNTKYGFEFKYPNDWIIQSDDSGMTLDSPENYKAQQEGCAERCPFDIIVSFDKNPTNLKVKDYYDGDPGMVAFDNPGADKEIKVDGRTAYEVYPTTGIGGSPEAVIIPLGNIFVNFSTYLDSNSQNKTFDQILSTFKFTSPQASIDTSGWKTYTNTKYGFEFKYPSDWIAEETVQKNGINLISPSLSKLLKEESKAGEGYDVQPNDIGVYFVDNPSGLNLDNFTKNYDKGWYQSYVSKDLISLDGRDAIKYSDVNDIGGSIPVVASFVQAKNKILVIELQYYDPSYTAEGDMLNNYSQILSTFKFIK